VKKLILVGTAVVALAIGTVGGLALSNLTNPKITMSCEANSCSVQLPGALLDEMNRTMSKRLSEPVETKTAGKSATTQHEAIAEDPDAELLRELEKFFK
jgi:hypothetical protein